MATKKKETPKPIEKEPEETTSTPQVKREDVQKDIAENIDNPAIAIVKG